jgi:hypothetical protein
MECRRSRILRYVAAPNKLLAGFRKLKEKHNNNDLCAMFYFLFIAIFYRLCWTGVKNWQGPSISSFLVFGHKFEGGGRGEG